MGLTITEAITLLPVLTYVLGRGVIAVIFGPLRYGRARTKAYGSYVTQRLISAAFNEFTPRQFQ